MECKEGETQKAVVAKTVLKKMLGCELHLAMNKNIECSRNVVSSLNLAIAIPTANW